MVCSRCGKAHDQRSHAAQRALHEHLAELRAKVEDARRFLVTVTVNGWFGSDTELAQRISAELDRMKRERY